MVRSSHDAVSRIRMWVVLFPGTHTPWAIIIGEFLIAISLAFFAGWTTRNGIGRTIAADLIAGASIFVAYALPYLLFMR